MLCDSGWMWLRGSKKKTLVNKVILVYEIWSWLFLGLLFFCVVLCRYACVVEVGDVLAHVILIRAKGVTPQWLIFLIRVGVGDPQGGGRGSGRLAPKRSCT
jgi:hypothetical protein